MNDKVKTIFDKSNTMRVAHGVPAFIYDDRLEQSAQSHADQLAAGRARPHDQLYERIKSSGFPISSDCQISRREMQANYSEGIVDQSDAPGTQSPVYLTGNDPNEGHYRDFFDPKITHIGIGIGLGARMNYVVWDYGIVCGGDDNEPKINPAWINGLIKQ